MENNLTTLSHPHGTHHSEELAHVEINAVVEGEEAAQHQDEDGQEEREVHHSLAGPVRRGIQPCYLQLRVRFDLQWEKTMRR